VEEQTRPNGERFVFTSQLLPDYPTDFVMQGPLGPKTLCNACGLRWAKQARRFDDTSEGNGANTGHKIRGGLIDYSTYKFWNRVKISRLRSASIPSPKRWPSPKFRYIDTATLHDAMHMHKCKHSCSRSSFATLPSLSASCPRYLPRISMSSTLHDLVQGGHDLYVPFLFPRYLLC
jgi:hypothetical protein